MTPREQFIAWLNDARSTELAQIPVLQNHANDAREYPEIRERDLQHLAETKRQAELIEELITNLGGTISTVKTVIGKITGLGHSVSTEIFPDELIKNFLADYAAEHFEIASYTSLIATARLIGENQCVPVLEEILAEEIAMAEWLEDNIPFATAESLKVTTGEDSDNARYRSKKRSLAARVAKPSVLVTAMLGIGAIGAGAAYLLRAKKQNGHNRINNNAQTSLNTTATDGGAVNLPEVTVVETIVIAVDDADNRATAALFSSAASNS